MHDTRSKKQREEGKGSVDSGDGWEEGRGDGGGEAYVTWRMRRLMLSDCKAHSLPPFLPLDGHSISKDDDHAVFCLSKRCCHMVPSLRP